jgi:hypothetical protein
MKLVAAAQGRLGSLLSRVLRDAAVSRAQDNEIEDWIRQQATNLPDAYQRDEIFRLLTDTILAVLDLRSRTALSAKDDPIGILDAIDPGWRDHFPLPVEDAQARQLLDQLVKDAAAIRPRQSAIFVSAQRILESDGENWVLQSSLNMPDFVEGSLLRTTFGLPPNVALSRSIGIQLDQGATVSQISSTRLAGRDSYRITRRFPISAGEDAIAEQWVSLVLADGTNKKILTHKGELLALDLPWLFAASGSANPYFLRQGSGAVPGTSGFLCIPEAWRIEIQGESSAQPCGSVIGLGRQVVKFSGTVKVFDTDDGVFRCRCSQVDEDKYVGWSGIRSTDVDWLSPKEAFRGAPKLCFLSPGMEPRPISGHVEWRCAGQRLLSVSEAIGPAEGTWLNHGEIEWRSRVVLLGKARSIWIDQRNSPSSGTLHFDDWRLAGVFSETDNICLSTQVINESLTAMIEYTGEGSPPEFCELSLLWRGNAQRARIRLPFPAFGSRCFDPHGRRLNNDDVLSAESLFGVRLVAFLTRTENAFLSFTLCDSGKELDSARLRLLPSEDSSRIEVRLIDHLPRINRMLANADDIDSYVHIELRTGSAPPASLRIARYACSLGRDTSNGYVFIETCPDSLSQELLRELALEAVPLDDPGEEPLHLAPMEFLGAGPAWVFPKEHVRGAPWLVFPRQGSSVHFRPLLWTTGDATNGLDIDSEIRRALRTSDPHERSEILLRAISWLAKDFAATDWRMVELTASQLYHLPFCALDMWRAFAKSNSGQAAIALRSHRFPAGFLDRFFTEMPSVWESIPLAVWAETMRAFEAFEKNETLSRSTLESRVEEIASLQPSLRVLLEVAETFATGIPTKDVGLVLQSRVNLSRELFTGNDSHYQKLLRDSADLVWPTELQPDISFARRGSLGRFLQPPSDPYFRDSVVNLPILLGASAATGIAFYGSLDKRARVIRRYQDFCPEWFTNAFDLTVARCIADREIGELEDLFGAKAFL